MKAAFTVSGELQAGKTIVFDASTSVGEALTYYWDFGDGTHGGAKRIPHVFSQAGPHAVKLMVRSGAESVEATQMLTLTDAVQATTARGVTFVVRDAAGVPVQDVIVAVNNSPSMASTNSSGSAQVSVGVGVEQTIRFVKAGYTAQAKTLTIADRDDLLVDVVLVERGAPVTIADVAQGGEALGQQGSRVVLPAGALLSGDTPAIGAIDVHITPINVLAQRSSFPGSFNADDDEGARGVMLSYGVAEFSFEQNGQKLSLAPGARADIDVPIYATTHRDGRPIAVGDEIPLWSLDEQSGRWVKEGTGLVVASSQSPTGFAMRANVGHFSWWNCDDFSDDIEAPVTCLVDNEAIANMSCRVSATLNISAVAPAYEVSTTIPFNVATPLTVPAGAPLLWLASAGNGLWRGSTMTEAGGGATITLTRFEDPEDEEEEGVIPIDTPERLNHFIDPVTDIDTFEWSPTAALSVLTVQQDESTLTGSVVVRDKATEGVVCSGTFGAMPFRCPRPPGVYTVVVSGDAVGTYSVIAGVGDGSGLMVGGGPVRFFLQSGSAPKAFTVPLEASKQYEVLVDRVGSATATWSAAMVQTGEQSVMWKAVNSADGPMPIYTDGADAVNITVSWASGPGGNFDISITEVLRTPTPVTLPSVTQPAVSVPVSFSGTAGQRVGFYARGPNGASVSNSAYVVNRLPVASVSDFGGVPGYTLPRDGTYYAYVNGSGLYLNVRNVEALPANSNGVTPALVNGECLIYESVLPAGGNAYFFNERGMTISSRRMFFPDGSYEQFVSTAFVVTMPGSYFFVVTTYSSATANGWGAGLSQTANPEPLVFDANGLALVSDELSVHGQINFRAVDLAEGDFVRAAATSSNLFGTAIFTDPVNEAEFWDSVGGAFTHGSMNFAAPGSVQAQPARVTETRRYFWGVYSANDVSATALGSYQLTLRRPIPQSLSVGTTTLTLAPRGDIKRYDVSLTGAYRVRVRYVGPSLGMTSDVNLSGYDSTGNSLGGAFTQCQDGTNPMRSCIASFSRNFVAGSQSLVVFGGHLVDYGTHPNNVQLSLLALDEPEQLPAGDQVVNATIASTGDRKYYRITPATSGLMRINVSANGGDGIAGDVYFYAESANWAAPLGSGSVFGNRDLNVTAGTSYIILVAPYELDLANPAGDETTGGYTLTVNEPPL